MMRFQSNRANPTLRWPLAVAVTGLVAACGSDVDSEPAAARATAAESADEAASTAPTAVTPSCPELAAKIADVVETSGEGPLLTVAGDAAAREAVAPVAPATTLRVEASAFLVPDRDYRVFNVSEGLIMLGSRGVSLSITKHPRPIPGDELTTLFGEGITWPSLFAKSFALRREDLSCQPGHERDVQKTYALLMIKYLLLPYDSAKDHAEYHAYRDVGLAGSLLVTGVARRDGKAVAYLVVPTSSGDSWLIGVQTARAAEVEAVLSSFVPAKASNTTTSSDVLQLAVRLMQGDACAAAELMKLQDDRMSDQSKRALARLAGDCEAALPPE